MESRGRACGRCCGCGSLHISPSSDAATAHAVACCALSGPAVKHQQHVDHTAMTTVPGDNSHWWQQPLMTTCHWCGFFSLKTLSSVPSAAELRIFFTSEKPRCDQKIKEKTSTLPIKPAYYCSATEQPMLAVATNWRLTAVELKLNAAKGGLYNTVGQSRKAVD